MVKKNLIILEGINGTGKTSVGRILGEELNYCLIKPCNVRSYNMTLISPFMPKGCFNNYPEDVIAMEVIKQAQINAIIDRGMFSSVIYKKYKNYFDPTSDLDNFVPLQVQNWYIYHLINTFNTTYIWLQASYKKIYNYCFVTIPSKHHYDKLHGYYGEIWDQMKECEYNHDTIKCKKINVDGLNEWETANGILKFIKSKGIIR